jgi:trehalose 6-phosphate phosphatase
VAPARTALVMDFDGSLAAIVDDPEAVVALPGVVETLGRATRRFGLVGIVSGRPVGFLHDRVPAPGVVLVGQYGLERWVDGRVVVDQRAAPYAPAVAEVARRAERELTDVHIERKGEIAVTLHWRAHAGQAAVTERWAAAIATELGLDRYPTRMAVELRPPVPVDKGAALTELVAGMEAALFAGDDHGDLSAFAALGRLRAEGALDRIARIAVRSAEEPEELVGAADLAVDGPEGLAAFLSELVGPG